MSNIPTIPEQFEIARKQAEQNSGDDAFRPGGDARQDIEAEDIEEEEQADVDRLEAIDGALTEKGGP